MRMARTAILIAAMLVCGFSTLWADSGTGNFFFTTYMPDFNATGTLGAANYNVFEANFSYNVTSYTPPTGSFTINSITGIANLSGADGIVFLPDGNLMVGGQSTQNAFEITTGGTLVKTVATGTGSYSLALNSAQTAVFQSWNGVSQGGSTALAEINLTGGGLSAAGTALAVVCAAANPTCSTDVRAVTFDTTNGKWYYGTAGDNQTGEFGTVAFNAGCPPACTTATLTRLLPANADFPWDHDVQYDPFTNTILANSGSVIEELDPTTGALVGFRFTPSGGVSELYDNLDTCINAGCAASGAGTGSGIYLTSSNTGDVTFIDDNSGLGPFGLGDSAKVFSKTLTLKPFLDDIAVQGSVNNPTTTSPVTTSPITTSPVTTSGTPEPASVFLFGSAASIAMFVLRKRITKS